MYAMFGTDVAYGVTIPTNFRTLQWYAMSGTDEACDAIPAPPKYVPKGLEEDVKTADLLSYILQVANPNA